MATTTTENIMTLQIPETGLTDKNRYATYINAWPQIIENWATNDYWSVRIEGALTEKDYTIIRDVPHGGKVTRITSISESGTCTATFKIGSTALGGAANAVSTSQQTQTHSSNNEFFSGNDLKISISSNSSCQSANFTIVFQKTSYN